MKLSLGVFFGLLTVLLWGVADFYASLLSRKYGVQKTLLKVQVLALALALIPGLLFYRASFFTLWSWGTMLQLVFIGLVQGASYIVFYKGLAEGLVSVVCPISACWSLVTVIWAGLFWGEALSTVRYGGIAAILLGVVLTSIAPKEVSQLNRAQLARGSVEGFLALILWGISLTQIVPFVREHGWFWPIFWMRVWAYFFVIIAFKLFPKFLNQHANLKTSFWPFLGVAFCDIGGLFCFSEGARVSFASLVAPLSSSFPLVTIALAMLFFHEKLSFSQKLGVAISLTGIFLISI
jgi:drug/metabolite transporter (DMT)-like permease